MNKNGLVLRLAVIVVFSAAAVGIIVTQLFYRITYHNELSISMTKIEQLHTTVSSTASIATYLEDEELMREVINGLVSNDIIEHVAIVTPTIDIASAVVENPKDVQQFSLYSPFEKTRKVGIMSITPNFPYIEQRAREIGYDNAVATVIQVAFVAIIITLVTFFIITKPIINIAQALHRIRPGTKERIKLPANHKQSEIGSLSQDINELLDKAEFQIGEERNLRNEVERLSKHFQMLFEYSTSPIVLTEPNGGILLYNRAFVALLKRLNIPLKKNFGVYLKELFEDYKDLEKNTQLALSNDEIATGEYKLLSQTNGDAVWMQAIISSTVDDAYKEHYQITLHDISQRKLQLDNLDHKANTDELTQLLNRRGAEKSIRELIQRKTPFTLFLLDLNKFKPINDIYGHDAGDDILRHISAQLTKALRRRDILSRWGGDEFVVILPNLTMDESQEVAAKVHEYIGKSYFLAKHDISLSVGASIGGVHFPDDESNLQALIEKADLAMYRAKETQKNDKDAYYISYRQMQTSSGNK